MTGYSKQEYLQFFEEKKKKMEEIGLKKSE